MTTTQATVNVSREAGSALSIYRFVVQDSTDGQYDLVGSAQGRMDGIAAESVDAAGDVFPMIIPNGAIAKVEAGAAIARDARVASDNEGRAITAVSGVGNYRGGIALEAASAAGQIIQVQFMVDIDEVA